MRDEADSLVERGEVLHGQIQSVLLGEELFDCARAVTLSLAATAGLFTSDFPQAEALISMLARHAVEDMRANWVRISQARDAAKPMHRIGDTKQ